MSDMIKYEIFEEVIDKAGLGCPSAIQLPDNCCVFGVERRGNNLFLWFGIPMEKDDEQQQT